MADIAIIDYGMGNVHSVYKALLKVVPKNSKLKITKKLSEINKSSHVVFPGQGAAHECMKSISENFNINDFKTIIHNKPFLGICMGLQVLMTSSQENNGLKCLNIIDGKALSIKNAIDKNYKVPHMGWNVVKQVKEHPVWNSIPDDSFFYFVHSYYVQPEDKSTLLATTKYDISFASAIYKENIIAVQFHPEKSSLSGLKLLENFINWDGQNL